MKETNTLLPNILYATPFSFYQNDLGHGSCRVGKKDHQNLPPSAVFLSETPFPAVHALAPSAC